MRSAQRTLRLKAMLEFIPLQCYECEELFDLPVELSTGETTTCPMCGTMIDIHRAEQFVLPCPQGVVIEETTPEQVCLSVSMAAQGSSRRYILIAVCISNVLIPVMVAIYELLVNNNPIDQILNESMNELLLMSGFCLFFVLFFLIPFRESLELTGTGLFRGLHLWRLGFRRRIDVETVTDAVSVQKSSPLFYSGIDNCHLLVKVKSSFRGKLYFPSFVIPRDHAQFITHVFRQRLHALRNRQADSADRPQSEAGVF